MYALLLICAMAIGQETEASAPTTTTGPVIRQFPISNSKAKEFEANIRDNNTTKFVIDTNLGGPTLTIESKSQWAFDRMVKQLKDRGFISKDATGVEITRVDRSLKIPADKMSEVDKTIVPFLDPKKITLRYNSESQTATMVGWSTEVERVEKLVNEKGLVQTTQQAPDPAKATANEPKIAARRIPIVSEKRDTVIEAVSALKVQGSRFHFTKDEDQHFLNLEAATETGLDEVQSTLEKLGLAIPTTSVKVFQIKHWKAEIIANGLQFNGAGRAKIVPDTKLNRLIVTGTKAELEKIEAGIALSDQPQDTANLAQTNTSAPKGVDDEKAGWQERQIPITAKKSKAEIDAIVEKLKMGGGLRFRFETEKVPEKGDVHSVVACSPLTKHLDAFEKELRDQGIANAIQPIPTQNESDFDAIVRIFNTTTDNIGTIKSAFDLEPISVQIEPGETKNSIKVQGRRGEVNKAIALLTERGFVVAAPEIKVFRLKYTVANDLAATLEKLGFNKVKIAPDVQSNSLVVSGAAKDIAVFEFMVGQLDNLVSGYSRLNVPRGHEKQMRDALTELGNPGVVVNSFPEDRPFAIDGPGDLIDKIAKWLEKRGVSDLSIEGVAGETNEKQVKIFRLKFAVSAETAATLEKLGFKSAHIAADAQTNSIVVTAGQKDIALIEALIANLDQEGKPKEKSDATTSDIRNYVYHLVNAPADDAVAFLKRMKLEGASVTADVRTNSVIIQATTNDLKVIIRVIAGLDMKDMSKDAPEGPFPNPAIGTLWTDFAKAEAKSISTAGELRAQLTQLGANHPKIVELRTKLETEVKTAFNLRHRLQQAEASLLRRQLTEIESRLTKREKNEDAIIKARVDSLLKMDELGWEAMTKPKAPKDDVAGGGNPLANDDATKRTASAGGWSKEKSEAWERVDREEYVGVTTEVEKFKSDKTMEMRTLKGVVICGSAMVPEGYLGAGNVVRIGERKLPSRLAGAAPMNIAAYRSDRYLTMGVTDFTHPVKDGESVWVFVPDQIESLVKAKVFLTPGADFSFEKNLAFGIEAEGTIEPGYIVCADNGDFLGMIASNEGSLGACLSAPAMRTWIERTDLEPPEVADPRSAMVTVQQVASSGLEFNGLIVNGVIVTHPINSDRPPSEIRVTGFENNQTYTVERYSDSADGRFGFIWCKEIGKGSGLNAAAKPVEKSDWVRFFTLVVRNQRFTGLTKSGHYRAAQVDKATESQLFFDSSERMQLPDQMPLGALVTTLGGHWAGVTSCLGGGAPYEIYTAKEILRLVDEETKKLNKSRGDNAVATNPAPTSTDSKGADDTDAANALWRKLKEPQAVIRVLVNHRPGNDSTKQSYGAIVNGCILLPRYLIDEEFVEVGKKSLPQREAGITPGGLYVYHRDRLPTGFTRAAAIPKDGDTVWTLTGGDQMVLTSGKVYSPKEASGDLPADSQREFSFESDGQIHPGSVVFAGDGDFLGIITNNKGSLAVCEHAQSIMESMKRMKIAAPNPTDPGKSQIWFQDVENKRGWNGIVLRGVIVTKPELLDQDLTKLRIGYGNSNKPQLLTKRHSCKILNDKLALIWVNEFKPTEGITEFSDSIQAADFACSLQYGYYIQNELIKSAGLKRTGTILSGPPNLNHSRIASRILECRDAEFDLDWYMSWSQMGEGVFDPGLHLLGVSITPLESEQNPTPKKQKVTVLKAKELFRIIDEETQKLAAEKPPAVTPSNTSPKPATESPSSEQIRHDAFLRITKRHKLHHVEGNRLTSKSSDGKEVLTLQYGAVVQGCVLYPYALDKAALANIDHQSLPVRLVTIASAGLYLYHRERLPKGFIDLSHNIREGEKVWTMGGTNEQSLASGKAFAKASPVDGFEVEEGVGFTVESEAKLSPGAVVYSDDGALLGVVTNTKGSIGACLSSPAIKKWLDETDFAPVNQQEVIANQVHIRIRKRGENGGPSVIQLGENCGTIVRGVIVANPKYASAPLSEDLYLERNEKTLTIERVAASPGGELALIWTKELSEKDGIQAAIGKLRPRDFVVGAARQGLGLFRQLPEDSNVRPIFMADNEAYAARIDKTTETEFELTWHDFYREDGQAVLTVDGHWVGVELPAPSNLSPNSKNVRRVLKAKEILRIVEEETKKLAAEKPPTAETPKPAPTTPEAPK